MYRKLLYIALGFLAAAAVGCKKSEESTTVKPSLYGASFSIVPFGGVGESFTLKPTGEIYSSKGDEVAESEIGYYWTVNSGDRDTVDTFVFTPETLGDYTITLGVFSKTGDYYSTSASHTISIIDPELGESLTGTGISATDDHITDKGVDYYYKRIAGLDWFRNNLAVPETGLCYYNAAVTGTVLGKYYTWEEAKHACPEGWSLPSADQWENLINEVQGEAGALMTDAWFNDTRMWSYWPLLKTETDSGFAALSSGYILLLGSDRKYQGIYNYAAFWTSTESKEDSEQAIYYYMNGNQRRVYSHSADKNAMALSVRCVR